MPRNVPRKPRPHIGNSNADRANELAMSIDLRDPQHIENNPAPQVPEVLNATPNLASTSLRRDTRWITVVLIIASAVGCMLLSSASPAGILLADAAYRGGFGALVVWSASRSRRWTWAVLSGVAALVAGGLLTQALAVLGLLLTANALRSRRRQQLVGTWIAVLALPALLGQGAGPVWRLSGGALEDPFAMSAIITMVATLPAIRSGWRTLSRRKRREIRTRTRRLGFAIVAVLAGSLTVCAAAIPSMLNGLQQMRAATESAQSGQLDLAAEQFDAAANEWAQGNQIVSGPWMVPARLVPILGQHIRTAQVVSGQSSALSTSAAVATRRVDPDALVTNGAINLDEIDKIMPAVDAFAATVDRATERIGQTGSPWLVPPVAERVDRSLEILIPASGVLNAAAEGLHVGTDLLGHDRPSNILVMFSTPAEARGAGGFIGNWAHVQATDGRVEIVEQYRTRELNELLADVDAELRADADYTERYGRFSVERHIQDVTLSPDFPSVAAVAADLFTQATSVRIDAVLSVDPFVIEKLLQFSGPLDRGDGTVLSGANAANELLIEQYERYGDDETGREAELRELTTSLVSTLLDAPPDPIAFATELAPLADQDRVSLWLADDFDGSIAERLGLDGGFPETSGDLLAVVHQNSGQNKIDSFLERSIAISTILDAGANEVRHDVTITLNNTAPSSGLSPAVLASNDQGLDSGTNRMMLSIYTALPVTSARIDGVDVPLQAEIEFGRAVYSTVLAIPAGDFATIDLQLAGDLDLSAGYEMTLGAQPTVTPDQVSWRIASIPGDRIVAPPDWASNSDGVRWSALLDRDRTMTFNIE